MYIVVTSHVNKNVTFFGVRLQSVVSGSASVRLQSILTEIQYILITVL